MGRLGREVASGGYVIGLGLRGSAVLAGSIVLALVGCGGSATVGSAGTTGSGTLSDRLSAAGYVAAREEIQLGDRLNPQLRRSPASTIATLRRLCLTLGNTPSDTEVQAFRAGCSADTDQEAALIDLHVCNQGTPGVARGQCAIRAFELLSTSTERSLKQQGLLLGHLRAGPCRDLVALGVPESTDVMTSDNALIAAARRGGDVTTAATALEAAVRTLVSEQARDHIRVRAHIKDCQPT